MANLPKDLNAVVERALQLSRAVPGFLGDNEARFLGTLAACAPAEGTIVEIGSYKGKSTVLLAFVAAHYGLGPVVAIDPHTSPSITDPKIAPGDSSFEEFVGALRSAKLEEQVEVHRAFSREVAKGWNRPIRLLWIDGDHTYRGTKEDFALFAFYLANGAIVAMHCMRTKGRFGYSWSKFCVPTDLDRRGLCNRWLGGNSGRTMETSFRKNAKGWRGGQNSSCPFSRIRGHCKG